MLRSCFLIVNDPSQAFSTSLQRGYVIEIHYDEMDDSDLEELFHEVEKGFFRTDRIALDQNFSIRNCK